MLKCVSVFCSGVSVCFTWLQCVAVLCGVFVCVLSCFSELLEENNPGSVPSGEH